MREGIIPTPTLAKVCGTLLVLTAVTIGLAQIPLGPWNLVISLGIAVAKASLIAVFFMELKLAYPLQRVAAGVALLWLAILIFGILDDVLTRGWLPVPGR